MPPANERQTRNLIDFAHKGYPLRVAARLARLRPHELAAWIEEGDKDGAEGEVLLFTQQWHEGQARFIAGQHDEIATSLQQAGKNGADCGARLALLERLHPELYARHAPDPAPIERPSEVPGQVAALTAEERAEMKAVLERRRQGQRANVSTSIKHL